MATKEKLGEVEANHATIINILEQEKECHKDTIDKLALEESSLAATKNELVASRVSKHEIQSVIGKIP